MKILYVEDNAVDADLARHALRGTTPPHEVEIVPTLAAAKARLKKPGDFDLVLSDLRLPDGSGLDVLTYIRVHKLPLAVTILTGSGDHDAAAEALKTGADDYIVKRDDYLQHLSHHLETVLLRYRKESKRKAQPLRVLYVEHNAFDIDLTQKHLAQYAPHIQLNVVHSAEKALDLFADREQAATVCDVLLFDYKLPGFNALDTLKILRFQRHVDIPAVLVTGQGSEQVAVQAMRLGFDGYLIKQPGYLHQLPAALESAFYRAELTREHAALKTSQQRYMELVTHIPVGVFRISQSPLGAMQLDYASPRFREIFGLPQKPQLLDPDAVLALIHPEDIAELKNHMIASQHSLEPLEWEGRIVIDDDTRWVRIESTATQVDNGVVVKDGIVRDITARRRAEERLRLSATVFDNTRDGITFTDTTPAILAVNRAFSQVTGYTEAEVLGKNPNILQSGRHDQDFYQALWATLKETGFWQGEIWNRRKNGEIYPEWLSISEVRNDKNEVTNYVAVFTDISQLKLAEDNLEHLSHYDPLTDLPNRRLFQMLLELATERAARHYEKLAVLMIDLDRFKEINDSLGHPAGDEVLRKMAERVQRQLCSEDTLARLGGDEFVILLEHLADVQEVAELGHDILASLSQPFVMDSGHEVFVSGSIGISLYPDDATSAIHLMRNTDTAMYRAKENGRNQLSFYTGNMNADALARLELEAALRGAIERQELLLHYQPKVDLRSGQVCGAEALIRWQRKDHGLIPPLQFIPLAEKSELIIAIGNWVIDSACRKMREWCDAGLCHLKIAINVSARQFRSGDLENVIAQALERYGVNPQHLELELTESMLMERPEETVLILQRLKQTGVKLSLDDFGTGYSSLTYLSRFPIDTLKIDQSFVASVMNEPTSAMIATSIIALAHRMQLNVVAEGVETEEQLGYLRMNRCDEMQGYYFSKPLPADEFVRLLAEEKSLPIPEAGSEDGSIRTILVVDDEANILSAVRRLLHREGYRILTANSAREGLETLAKNPVQVIMTDQRMPEMCGTEFLRRVKELYPDTVRIVLSGYTDLESVTQSINEGALYKFLTKPWEDDQLRAQIRDAFHYYEAIVKPRSS